MSAIELIKLTLIAIRLNANQTLGADIVTPGILIISYVNKFFEKFEEK